VNPVDIALDLADQGFPVFPCLAGTKSPAIPRDEGRGFLDASLDPVEIRRMFAYPGAALVGVPTGHASGFDVIDIDPRHGGDAWADFSRLPATRAYRTRSGGLHVLFRSTPGLRSSASRIAPGVDVRAEGGYVIAWWVHGCPVVADAPVADPPDWLIEAARTPVRVTDYAGEQAESPPDADAVVNLLDRLPNPASNGRDVYVQVMLAAAGCAQEFPERTTDIALAAARWAAKWPGSPGLESELAKFESDFVHRDRPLAGWRNLRARGGREIPGFAAESAASEFPPLPDPATQPTAEPPAWTDRLQRAKPAKDGTPGAIKGNLFNATLALANTRALSYDLFADRVLISARPPWSPGQTSAHKITDVDATRIAIWLQSIGIQVPSALALEAAVEVARQAEFHPVRQYLSRLKYDGAGRLDRWLVDHVGAEDTPLNRAVGAKFLISLVARVMNPGAKVDTFLILEGPQGLRKSSLFQTLVGAEWFTDQIPDLGSKDALMQLQGKWLIEWAELDTLGRADMSRAKAFISTATDTFRRPYGRVTEDVPRQSVMCGTVNPNGTGYLRDETGNRRFWPVSTGHGWADGQQVDIPKLAVVRDQLFAEAYARYQSGEKWWLDTRALELDQAAAADLRFAEDTWADVISTFLVDKNEVGMTDILEAALRKPKERWTPVDAQRVGRIMSKRGWSKRLVRVPGSDERQYRYFRSGEQVVVPIRSPLALAELAG
jgi:hypothetical protein